MTIDLIGMPTARRPEALRRCIASYAENAAAYGRAPTFLITDDDTAARAPAVCVEALGDAAARCGARVRYVGMSEKLALVRRILHAGALPPDVVRFAFFDDERSGLPTAGANRNALFAQTHGSPLLVVDDDTVCVTHRLAGDREGPIVRPAADGVVRDPSEWWPLGSRSRAADICDVEPLDCLGEHERWLGQPIDGLAGDARVRLTVNGLIGDCGWGTPTAYLAWRGASLDRLTASDADYEDAITSREVVRAVSRVTLCARADFMSTFFAVDNTVVLPPFAPVGRGADHVFAAIVAKCCSPQAVIAHLPVALLHRPAKARSFWRGEITRSSAGIDLSTFFRVLVGTAPDLPDASPAARLARCGQHLEEVASRPRAEFAEIARAAVGRLLEQRIAELEVAAEDPARPPTFRRDLLAHVAGLQVAARQDEVHVPLELLWRAPDDAPGLAQRLLRRFGRLLAHWPALLDVARDARQGRVSPTPSTTDAARIDADDHLSAAKPHRARTPQPADCDRAGDP
jgi:hypothetical protein